MIQKLFILIELIVFGRIQDHMFHEDNYVLIETSNHCIAFDNIVHNSLQLKLRTGSRNHSWTCLFENYRFTCAFAAIEGMLWKSQHLGIFGCSESATKSIWLEGLHLAFGSQITLTSFNKDNARSEITDTCKYYARYLLNHRFNLIVLKKIPCILSVMLPTK